MALGKKTGGRKAGTPNKTTAITKEAISKTYMMKSNHDRSTRAGMGKPILALSFVLSPSVHIQGKKRRERPKPLPITHWA